MENVHADTRVLLPNHDIICIIYTLSGFHLVGVGGGGRGEPSPSPKMLCRIMTSSHYYVQYVTRSVGVANHLPNLPPKLLIIDETLPLIIMTSSD